MPRDRRKVPRPEGAETLLRDDDREAVVGERRRASRSLWQACEALLSAGEDAGALARALETLREAFDCDGVALHVSGADGAIEPWCARGRWATRPGDLRDCIALPLMRGTEKVGALDLKARPGQRWRPGQMGLIRTAAGALGAALGTRLELQRLRHQPGRDAATGLPDERAFHARLSEELARARRHGLALALVLIEVDHFAQIVARYGRDAATDVLGEVTLALKLALRDSDVLAHFDGGCFAVLLPETASGPALRCADRLQRTLEEHRFARVARVSATAAVATSPRDGMDTLELLERVRSALQVARKSGQRRVVSPAPASLQ